MQSTPAICTQISAHTIPTLLSTVSLPVELNLQMAVNKSKGAGQWGKLSPRDAHWLALWTEHDWLDSCLNSLSPATMTAVVQPGSLAVSEGNPRTLIDRPSPLTSPGSVGHALG